MKKLIKAQPGFACLNRGGEWPVIGWLVEQDLDEFIMTPFTQLGAEYGNPPIRQPNGRISYQANQYTDEQFEALCTRNAAVIDMVRTDYKRVEAALEKFGMDVVPRDNQLAMEALAKALGVGGAA